jgi:TetR/AcrR family transcriptional regulator, cholesterol catabolism regulator
MKDQAQRKVILDTAFDKFRRFGIRRVTVDELARDLRISKKTIYQHFPDKEAIVRGCAERVANEIIPAVKKALEVREPITDRVLGVWQALAGIPRLLSPELLADIKAGYPRIWEDIDRQRHDLSVGFEKLVNDGIRSGEIRPEIHPKVALRILLAIMENVMVPDVLAAGEFTHAQAIETVFNLFSGGIFVRPVSPKRKSTRQ